MTPYLSTASTRFGGYEIRDRDFELLTNLGRRPGVHESVETVAAQRQYHRLVERLHALGPRAVEELLREISDAHDIGPDVIDRLIRYARLNPDVVRALGADWLK